MKWLNKMLINQQLRKNRLKSIHVCNECGNTDQVTRRLSTLYLGIFIIIGVIVGLWFNFFLGLLTTLLCIVVTVQTAKPLCKKCFTSNIRLASVAEIQEKKEQQKLAQEQTAQTEQKQIHPECDCDGRCRNVQSCSEHHE